MSDASESPLSPELIQQILEAALLASDGPLTPAAMAKLFAPGELDEEQGSKQIREALKTLGESCEDRGVELKRVASGYRFQVKQDMSVWVSRLWEEKPPRYTRALLETLALVAYKQPVTRGDIEQVRGVSVSQNIMRTLLERDWVKVVGHREVPGRPAMYGTTKAFLDYFNVKSLDDLPPLAEIREIFDPENPAQPPSDAPAVAPVQEANLQEEGHAPEVEANADADTADNTEADTNDEAEAGTESTSAEVQQASGEEDNSPQTEAQALAPASEMEDSSADDAPVMIASVDVPSVSDQPAAEVVPLPVNNNTPNT